ncbi:MAG: SDR family oxidoreductase [Betaproteobacteria bacterium]|nr:SDR family oxidoreductase [Betaproteobacteria bacterium]
MSFEPISQLNGHVAVITGGKGAIGLATARRLAALGARIVSIDRSEPEKVQALLDALPQVASGPHMALTASITDSAALNAAAKEVKQRAGRCDILVNSAGFTKPVAANDLKGLTDELFDEVVQTNLRGVFSTIRAFTPLLQASGDGLIVNVSSIAGFTGAGSNLAYAAAKAGVDLLTKSLAKALAPQIRVLAVSPGVVDSSFVPGRGADFNEKAAATIPLKRIGHVEDTASAIEACATTMRFATGSRFVVDGGRSL